MVSLFNAGIDDTQPVAAPDRGLSRRMIEFEAGTFSAGDMLSAKQAGVDRPGTRADHG